MITFKKQSSLRWSVFALGVALSMFFFGNISLADDLAVPFTEGNIVVSNRGTIYEVTLDGELVQQLDVPEQDLGHVARDLVFSESGQLQVFNGTFEPWLSTWDIEGQSWSHRRFNNWGVANNGTYGGIATWNSTVFLSNMLRNPTGVLAYDTATESVTRFATGIEPNDLTVGFDGFLYTLSPGGSPMGRFIDVFNPANLSFVKQIPLTPIFGHRANRALAVDAESNIYIINWEGEIRKVDPQGNVIASIRVSRPELSPDLYDIDLDGFGNVIVGDRSGNVIITDTDLSTVRSFRVPGVTSGVFVGFVTSNKVKTRHPGDFYGTDRDDEFEVDLEQGSVTVNGDTYSVQENVKLIRFFGGGGGDTVICRSSTAETEFAILDLETGRMNVDSNNKTVFRAFQFEKQEFVGSNSSDSALLVDSKTQDSLFASPGETYLTQGSNGGKRITASDVDAVYATSFHDEDSAVYKGTHQSEQLYCDLESLTVRAISGDSLVVMRDFKSFHANGFINAEDSTVIRTSSGTDYLYAKENFCAAFNMLFDYSFATFEKVNVYGDDTSSDRATLIKTPNTRIRESENWKQAVGPGFRNTVVNFGRVDFVVPD
jgi:hypothetical protein